MTDTRPVALKTNATFTAAFRQGKPIETVKKRTAGKNTQRVTDRDPAHIDEETADLRKDFVDHEVGQLIARLRAEKGMTQRALATRISEKPSLIADMEAGRALKNSGVLIKIERVLGVKLRGKEIGQPLYPPKKT